MRFQGIASVALAALAGLGLSAQPAPPMQCRSEEHTSELQSQSNLVCRLLLEKKKKNSRTDGRNTRLNSTQRQISQTRLVTEQKNHRSTNRTPPTPTADTVTTVHVTPWHAPHA